VEISTSQYRNLFTAYLSVPQDCSFVENIQLINENNENLWRKLFIGIGSILNDATEFIFPKSITSADSYFVRNTAEFW